MQLPPRSRRRDGHLYPVTIESALDGEPGRRRVVPRPAHLQGPSGRPLDGYAPAHPLILLERHGAADLEIRHVAHVLQLQCLAAVVEPAAELPSAQPRAARVVTSG